MKLLANRPGRKAVGGFNLLQLVLFLLMLSIAASLAIPGFFERSIVTLENGAVLLAEDLRTAQNRAAYSKETLFMRFFEDGDGYEVVRRSGEPIDDPRTGRPFVRRYSTDGVFEGLKIVKLDAGPDRTLVFSTIGETSDTLEVNFEFLEEQRRLLAERSTGIVSIEGTTSGFRDDGF